MFNLLMPAFIYNQLIMVRLAITQYYASRVLLVLYFGHYQLLI